MKSLFRTTLFVVYLACSHHTFAQRIKGVVTADNEPAFAANVFLSQHKEVCAVCNENGEFELLLNDSCRNDTVVISYIGYKNHLLPVSGINPIVKVELREGSYQLDEIVIRSDPFITKEFSVTRLDKASIYMYPSSEGDPLKAIKLLPYSTSTTESANPELRGSSGDNSRVIVNGVPIYNPVRNQQLNGLGNFSLFNPEIIGEEEVYPGNPPLEYGRSTAGVIDIKTADELDSEKTTNISLSLANMGAMHSRNISKKSFIQVYFNRQFSNLYKGINHRSLNNLKNFSSWDIGVNYHIRFTKSFIFNLYSYFINEKYNSQKGQFNFYGEAAAHKIRNFNILNFKYYGGNNIFSLNYGSDFSTSRYNYGNINDQTKEGRMYSSISWKGLFFNNLSMKSGVDYSYSSYAFSGYYPLYFFVLNDKSHSIKQQGTVIRHSIEYYIYAKYTTGCWSFGGGIRNNIPTNGENGYCSLQANAKYTPNAANMFIFSTGKYFSYSQPNYYSRAIEQISSQQISLDYKLSFDNVALGAAIYDKIENNPLYIEEAGVSNNSKNYIFGLELSTKYNIGHFEFNGSYTFLNSTFSMEGSSGKYRGANDLNYLLKISANYINVKIGNISLSYTARPGLYYTPLKGLSQDESFTIPVFGEYNSAQYRHYSTLDVTLNKYVKLKKTGVVAFLSISNILNHKNDQYFYYDKFYSNKIAETYQNRLFYTGIMLQF